MQLIDTGLKLLADGKDSGYCD